MPMTRIRFADIRFFDPKDTVSVLERRFLQFLRQRRMAKLDALRGPDDPTAESRDRNGAKEPQYSAFILQPDVDKARARAIAIVEGRKRASGMAHLNKEDASRLAAIKEGARLVPPPSVHRTDEIAAEMHAEFPWLNDVSTRFRQDLRCCAEDRSPGIRLPPIILDGAPGVAKTAFTYFLGGLLGMPVVAVNAGTENAGFGLSGSQRTWSTAQPGRLINSILDTGCASQLVLVDEVEKAGDVRSDKGIAYNLETNLLPLLEPTTAARWTSPYFEIQSDLSWVSWVLTSNNAAQLHPALRSRCHILRVRDLTAEEMSSFVAREGLRRDLNDAAIAAAIEAVKRLRTLKPRVDLRDAIRIINQGLAIQRRPPLH